MGFLNRAKQVQDGSAEQTEVKEPLPSVNAQPTPARQAAPVSEPLSSVNAQPTPARQAAPVSEPLPSANAQNLGNVNAQADLPHIEIKTKEEIDSEVFDPRAEEIKKKLHSLVQGVVVETVVDQICSYLDQNKRKATILEISNAVSLSINQVEDIVRLLAEKGVVSIYYSLLFLKSPVVTLLLNTKKSMKQYELDDNKKLLEKYIVFSDFVVANVNIWSIAKETTPIYQVIPHETQYGTDTIIRIIIDELAKSVNSEDLESADMRKYQKEKASFFKKAKVLLEKNIPNLSEEMLYLLSGIIVHQTFGLGELDIIMSDDWLEEVAINAKNEPISVYHKKYGWLKSSLTFSDETEVYNLALHIGRRVGKQITSLSPIMDAHMQTGDRVAATLFPISTEGDTLTIRRFSRNPWTIVHMINKKNNTLSQEIMSFLWLAMQYELNLLVVGGTASGKTSVLNTLSALSPPTNRIISIEDTREISLPQALHWNWVPLVSKSSNAEGEGEVSMLDLMIASLRMRPDRIVVGEIRRKEQAEALFEAMHTGHAVSATMHADSAEQVKHRLTQPPIDIPENEIEALQLILVQYRDRRRGIRRTLEVAEILPGSSDSKVNLNYLFRWRPRNDTFVKDEASIRVVEDLNLHTGMTEKDISNDLAQKEEILDWMLQNEIYDMDKVGQIMRIYYKYPELLIDVVKDKGKYEHLLHLDHEQNL